MLSYHLLYMLVQIGLPLTADQYVGVCGSNSAQKYCFGLSTLVKSDTSVASKTFLVNDTYKNPVCPTNVRTAKSFSIPSEFDIYPFDLQCSDTNISVFLPQRNISYVLRPFHEVSGTKFSLLTECNMMKCICIIVNVNITVIHILTQPSRGTLKIETVPKNMTNGNHTYTMTNPLEMIVVAGSLSQLSNTYVNSNDSVTVFCVGDSDHAARGILQLPPLAFSATTTNMVQLPHPSVSTITYRNMVRQRSQSECYIVRLLNGNIGLSVFDKVTPNWYRYVKDFNASFNYRLLTVAWTNVSGSSLDGPEAQRYKHFTFKKAAFVYRDLTMSSTTSATDSSTRSTTVSIKASSSATSQGTTSHTTTVSSKASSSATSQGTTNHNIIMTFPNTMTSSATSKGTTSHTTTFPNTVTSSATSQGTTSHTTTFPNTVTSSATSQGTTSHTTTFPNTVTSSATSQGTTSHTTTFPNTVTSSATSQGTTSHTTTDSNMASSPTSPATTTEPGSPSPTTVLNASGSTSNSVKWPYTYTVGMCTYRCDSPVLPVDLNDPVQRQMLQKQLKELRKQLTVNKTELSSTKRRKESAMDHRMSAKAFGLVGTAMLCTCIGVIILADLPKMSKIIRDFRAQVCKSDTIPVKQSKMRRPSRVRKQSEAKLVPFIRSNRISSDTSV